ncbi:MAG: RagB/SusD family nutrient uptake outer membrane protein [Prevotella sp.]|nr:RagB/SusD family nutrient uptake outer membrane protein [Prevotella sp.]MBR1462537.1 RagB/SusD family nutrient uptake outer membrane protein [Prevotella sp.]
MKKIIYCMIGAAMLLGTTSCSDFLDQSSPSEVDKDFVLSGETSLRATLNGIYENWRSYGLSHGNGTFYNMIVSSSDTELQPEGYSAQINRWLMSYFWGYSTEDVNGAWGTEAVNPDGNGSFDSTWNNFYDLIGKCNAIIQAFEAREDYEALLNGPVTALTQIYGEAIAMRATCYFELIRHYGDCAFLTVQGEEPDGLTNRDYVAEYILNDLKKVIPVMYRSGESTIINKSMFNRTYAEGLVGRICLWMGGYQTRRTDLGDNFYTLADGTVLSFTKVSENASRKCFYGRRNDWRSLYEIAEKYLGDAYQIHGDVVFQSSDPRSGDRQYGNPFQYVFQQMMVGYEVDNTYADESVYEVPETNANGNSERPYAFGRPSEGGGSDNYPCKSYSQARLSPMYYYGDFDPEDMRRDVTCVVTGSTGQGAEQLINFKKGSRTTGGIPLNKWDENRMTLPWTVKQRQSGINNPFMRFSDIMLMLAEVRAALHGDGDATARSVYTEVRARAFGSAAKAKVDEQISKWGSLERAVIEERKFEFGGEGSRRWDLIRANLLETTVPAFWSASTQMINDLRTKGYHEFENGNVISNYVWTKLVDAKSLYGYRLTTQCPADKQNDPVLYPGWRGQNDDWASVGQKNNAKAAGPTAGDKTNLAIKGLFTFIDPDGAEAAALEADGYTKQPWGIDIANNENQYNRFVFAGFKQNDPPVYMLMMGPNTIKNSNGKFTNGYGFRNN